MDLSKQLCCASSQCTGSQWLQDKIWENLDMTIECNSELDSIITLLANKLWLYASETAQSIKWPVSKSSIEGSIIYIVNQQREALYLYKNLLHDFRVIVEQI